MRGALAVATTAKHGNPPESNMDACWPRTGGAVDAPVVRIAVSDGATEHFLSRLWAERLVPELATVPARYLRTPRLLHSLLDRAQEAWISSLRGYAEERKKPFRWFEKEKLWEGAAATFLAACFEDGEGSGVGEWHAAALGDTNFFQVSAEGRLAACFPLSSAESFNDTPALLVSELGSLQRSHDYMKALKDSMHGASRAA